MSAAAAERVRTFMRAFRESLGSKCTPKQERQIAAFLDDCESLADGHAEMLEALQALMEPTYFKSSAIHRARAAISKATGEPA